MNKDANMSNVYLSNWTSASPEAKAAFADMLDAQCEGKTVQCKYAATPDAPWYDVDDLLKLARPARYIFRVKPPVVFSTAAYTKRRNLAQALRKQATQT